MTKASDNDYPSILVTEQSSAPASPAASHQRLYIRTSDHTLVTVNSSGTVTPVGGSSAFPPFGYNTVATDQTTTSATFTDLTTSGPAVTLTVNTKVKVTLTATMFADTQGCDCRMSVALSSGNTLAAADTNCLEYVAYDGANNSNTASAVVYLSGLTPGSTVFTAKYRRGTGGTAHFVNRKILVECMD